MPQILHESGRLKRAGSLFISLFKTSSFRNSLSNQDIWTFEIIRMMLVFSLIPVLIVLWFHLTGTLTLAQAHPAYVFLAVLLAGWIIAIKGKPEIAGYIPSALCFLYAVYCLLQSNDLHNISIFLFCLGVVLAGVLLGLRAGFVYSFLSLLIFCGIHYRENSTFDITTVISILTLLIGLLTALMLQAWYQNRLQEILKERFLADQKIEEEHFRRIQVEEISRYQESQIKRLTDQMTDLVAEMDLEGRYLYASPSYEKVLGYSPEQLKGLVSFDLIHPEDKPVIEQVIQKYLLEGNSGKAQYRVRHASGNYIWVDSSGVIATNEETGQKSMIVSSRDVTEQKLAEENNRLSERKFRSVIETIPLGIHQYYVDETSSLIFCGFNPAADKLLVKDHKALLGKKILIAFPALAGTGLEDKYRKVAETGVPLLDVQQIVYRNGRNYVYEISAFQSEPGKVTEIFSDITEKRRAEEALQLSEEKFSKAFRTSPDSININRLSDGLYLDCNDGFTRMTGFTRDDVLGKTSLEINIWVDKKDREKLVEGLKRDGYVENLQADFRTKVGEIVHGLMSASLLRINGEDCLLNITRDISERIKAEQQAREAHQQLEQAYEATLKGWARALELREHETANHSRRVVELSVSIGRAVNLNPEELDSLERGALLHDIGKMGVPDSILLKPGPLSADEWVIMRQHPENAYHLLKDVDYLRQAMEIPYSHHEHWDGSGYPRGLKGDEIPLSARIFTLVDVWDALLSDRPYRPAWKKPDVMKYVEEQSGKLFDPELVPVFLKKVQEEG